MHKMAMARPFGRGGNRGGNWYDQFAEGRGPGGCTMFNMILILVLT